MLTYHLYTLSKPVSPDLLGGTLPSGSAGICVRFRRQSYRFFLKYANLRFHPKITMAPILSGRPTHALRLLLRRLAPAGARGERMWATLPPVSAGAAAVRTLTRPRRLLPLRTGDNTCPAPLRGLPPPLASGDSDPLLRVTRQEGGDGSRGAGGDMVTGVRSAAEPPEEVGTATIGRAPEAAREAAVRQRRREASAAAGEGRKRSGRRKLPPPAPVEI